MKKLGIFGILLPITLQFACSIKSSPLIFSENPDDKSISAEQKVLLSYNYVVANVLQKKCIGCHGDAGGVNLQSYENTFSQIQAIKESVFVKKTMPKRGRLNQTEKAILWNWIELGAPERSELENPPVATTSPSPLPQNPELPHPQPPVPPIDPVQPNRATYLWIQQNIFETKCVDCHAVGKEAKNILLDRENLLNSPLELVIPENPDDSGLVIALERKDSKRMPPADEGYAPLSEVEITAIREWIARGAKD